MRDGIQDGDSFGHDAGIGDIDGARGSGRVVVRNEQCVIC